MRVMQRKPRRPEAHLINDHLLLYIALVSSLFVVAVFGISNYSIKQSYTASHAQILALHTLVILEIFHLLFIRNIFNDKFTFNFLKGSSVLCLTISLVLVTQIAVIYLPILQTIFGTSALKLEEWFIICIVGVLLFIILESEKQLRLLFKRKLSIV
jgi:magnesium-transporting ATPase (P-type)